MYKFRNATVQDELELQFEFGGKKTDLQLNWQSYLSMAMCIPNIIILQLNSLFGHKIKAQPRILTVLVINILLFIVLLTLTKIDSDNWQFEFMIASLFNAILLAVMEAVFQGALYGVVGKFPPEYIGAVVQGKIKLIQSKMYTTVYYRSVMKAFFPLKCITFTKYFSNVGEFLGFFPQLHT